MKDLTNSFLERKNVLNNALAIQEIYDSVGLVGVMFDGKFRYTKLQVASFFEVDPRTIDRLLENNRTELKESGYQLFTGIKLKQFKDAVAQLNDINVVQSNDNEIVRLRATSLSVFTFKAFLNVGMLLQGSEKAKELRSLILNIIIDFLNKKLGGTTKYINQREEDYVSSAIRELNYRKEFTNALDFYIVKNGFKYSQITDKIYMSIFKENAKEYRLILKLNSKESVRSTMYSEVLDLVSSFENGFGDYLKKAYLKNNSQRFRLSEAHELFKQFEELTNKVYEPLREKARSIMASRDMAFRDALHEKLKNYISAVSPEDFDKFLGDKSKLLEERLKENMDVFIRLKDK